MKESIYTGKTDSALTAHGVRQQVDDLTHSAISVSSRSAVRKTAVHLLSKIYFYFLIFPSEAYGGWGDRWHH